MYVKGRIQCPGCKFSDELQFEKPGLMKAAIFKFKCSTCQSLVLARVEKEKGEQRNDRFKVSTKLWPSKFLLEMIKEEAEHQKAEQATEVQNEEVAK